MDAKVGDRISIDGRTVGQPRRHGKVADITEGLSGKRYTINWDDGSTSTFAPSGGNLIVEGKGRGGSKKTGSTNNRSKSSAKSKSGAKGKTGSKEKSGAEKPAAKKPGAKKASAKKKAKR